MDSVWYNKPMINVSLLSLVLLRLFPKTMMDVWEDGYENGHDDATDEYNAIDDMGLTPSGLKEAFSLSLPEQYKARGDE